MNATTLKYCMAGLVLAWSVPASASSPEVSYKGPDALTLVTRPNRGASSIKPALLQVRPLPEGTWAKILPPLVSDALERCSMQGITAVNVEAAITADRIGESSSRLEGLGMYVNLSRGDRVSGGNWFLAPYYSIKVTLVGEGNADPTAIFEYDRLMVPTDFMSEEAFMEVRTEDVQKTIVGFVKQTLPPSLSRAFPKRCPAIK